MFHVAAQLFTIRQRDPGTKAEIRSGPNEPHLIFLRQLTFILISITLHQCFIPREASQSENRTVNMMFRKD